MRQTKVHTYSYLLVKQTYGKRASKIWLYMIIITFPQFTITTKMWFNTFSNVLINCRDSVTLSVIMRENLCFPEFELPIGSTLSTCHTLYIPSNPRTPSEHNFSDSKLESRE